MTENHLLATFRYNVVVFFSSNQGQSPQVSLSTFSKCVLTHYQLIHWSSGGILDNIVEKGEIAVACCKKVTHGTLEHRSIYFMYCNVGNQGPFTDNIDQDQIAKKMWSDFRSALSYKEIFLTPK